MRHLDKTWNLIVSWHRADGTARAARIVAIGDPRVLGLSVLADASVVFAGAFSETTVFGPLDAAKHVGGYEARGRCFENNRELISWTGEKRRKICHALRGTSGGGMTVARHAEISAGEQERDPGTPERR